MYKIIRTTDQKYIGLVIDSITDKMLFPDGFIMYIGYTKIENDTITIGNDNYTITFKKEE